MALSLPQDVIKDDPELRWLNSICLPSWERRSKERHVARPERPEYAIALGLPRNAEWEGVMVQLREGMRRNVAKRATLETAKATGSAKPIKQAASTQSQIAVTAKSSRMGSWASEYPNFFPVIATILYAQECDLALALGNHTFDVPEYDASVQEHLDSCMAIQPVKQHDPQDYRDFLRFAHLVISYANYFLYSWDTINFADVTAPDVVKAINAACDKLDPSDFAMMLYYFYTHHRVLDGGDRVEYTGVMQTLTSDIPRFGNSERLHRKLSVDYNVLTSQVHGPLSEKWAMKSSIRGYTEWHHLPLEIPTKKTRMEPYAESKEKYTPSWKKWMVIILIHNVFQLLVEWLLPSLVQKQWLWYTIVVVGPFELSDLPGKSRAMRRSHFLFNLSVSNVVVLAPQLQELNLIIKLTWEWSSSVAEVAPRDVSLGLRGVWMVY
ncbi:hypothetical protein PG993_010909 [Apiospora rasikravindrae]|uniref:Uncharacterized protein n=1 Tax=Apiospora rasikravindrae TaxID=990691 RepID=A0ABR1SCR5_9PEZI